MALIGIVFYNCIIDVININGLFLKLTKFTIFVFFLLPTEQTNQFIILLPFIAFLNKYHQTIFPQFIFNLYKQSQTVRISHFYNLVLIVYHQPNKLFPTPLKSYFSYKLLLITEWPILKTTPIIFALTLFTPYNPKANILVPYQMVESNPYILKGYFFINQSTKINKISAYPINLNEQVIIQLYQICFRASCNIFAVIFKITVINESHSKLHFRLQKYSRHSSTPIDSTTKNNIYYTDLFEPNRIDSSQQMNWMSSVMVDFHNQLIFPFLRFHQFLMFMSFQRLCI